MADRTSVAGQCGREPRMLGGIANFGWVEPARLARGEQPRPELGGYAALQEAGVTCLLSLRESRERENLVGGRPFPAYDVDDEAAACRDHGFRLVQVPFLDRAVPPAAGLTEALVRLDAALSDGETVYIHCLAGIGRTGLVASLWRLAQGGDGDDVAADFARYWLEFGEREEALVGPLPGTILSRYGFPLQWWALLQVAGMVGSPVRQCHHGATPQAPENGDEWLDEAARTLVPCIVEQRLLSRARTP